MFNRGDEMHDDENRINFPEMLAFLAHDMKNSLGILLGTLEDLIGNLQLSNSINPLPISPLLYEAKRVNNSLVQLLTFYRMGNSQYTTNIVFNLIPEFIEDVVIQNKVLLDFKGIKTDIICPADLSWFLDRDLISGVLNNVLNNAFKYARDRITISAYEEAGTLILKVEDNGYGYPDYLLESLSICGTGINFKTGGTGLGLYFASLAASVHKNKNREGFIKISNGGRYSGGCFEIYLP